jgi:3-methyladenine DNA glycosylase/8-oxoguanine DNA glycosylase
MTNIEEKIQYLINKDLKLDKVIKTVGICKIGKNPQNIFSYLIGVIVGQRIRFSEAKKIRKQLYEETNNYNFTPNDILNIDWTKFNISVNMVETIKNVANYFIKNKLENNISKNNFDDLIKIKGIGIWTITTIMIEYNIDDNLFVHNDKHVNKKIKEIYGNVNIKDLLELWNPYKSIVFWYLWKYQLN